MSWERDPLWAKARVFFERAFASDREDPTFGLWCSLGLELLARSAVASVSQALLAEHDHRHTHLLHALGRGSGKGVPKSISATFLFELCVTLFPGNFSTDDEIAARALINSRNAELHSGGAAFCDYPLGKWLAGFYRACHGLCEAQSETLESLFGEEEAKHAKEVLAEDRTDLMHIINQLIADHRKSFSERAPEEQKEAKDAAATLGIDLSRRRHHKVTCPACESSATIQGMSFGREHVTEEDDSIVVRQAVRPTCFSCTACGLTLTTFAALEIAGLSNPYTRRTTYTPAEYYGLIDPDDLENYDEGIDDWREYDNE